MFNEAFPLKRCSRTSFDPHKWERIRSIRIVPEAVENGRTVLTWNIFQLTQYTGYEAMFSGQIPKLEATLGSHFVTWMSSSRQLFPSGGRPLI